MTRSLKITVAALAAAALVAVASAAASPPQGIVVHGRWTLTVRSHGRVVRVRRVENSLQGSGAKLLIKLLAGTASTGHWAVELNGHSSSSDHPCGFSNVQYCWFSIDSTFPSASFSGPVTKDLTVTPDLTTPQLTVKGTISADHDASIYQVESGFSTCAGSTAPSNCNANSLAIFTFAGLSSPVPVTAGQQVAITVHFTFS